MTFCSRNLSPVPHSFRNISARQRVSSHDLSTHFSWIRAFGRSTNQTENNIPRRETLSTHTFLRTSNHLENLRQTFDIHSNSKTLETLYSAARNSGATSASARRTRLDKTVRPHLATEVIKQRHVTISLLERLCDDAFHSDCRSLRASIGNDSVSAKPDSQTF